MSSRAWGVAFESAADRIGTQVAELREALEIGGDRFTPEVAARAREDLDDVEERLAQGVDRTVVALVGGTGSGKSSLFNVISGLPFAEVGVRRPTTSQPAACTWGGAADELLDMLGVHDDRRIRRESPLDGVSEDALAGLVLLDMPDHDSIAPEHARLVERLVPLVDLLVWVVDPQKYADNALHERYLRALVDRQDGMLVLVNQVDTVPQRAVHRIAGDLHRLLEADGLHDVPVLATSAVTGEGIREVRDLLAEVVAGESMAAWVAGVEVSGVAARLAADLAPPAGDRPDGAGPGVPDGAALDAAAETVVDQIVQVSGVVAVERAIASAVASPRRRLALVRPGPPALATAGRVRDDWVERMAGEVPRRWAAALDAAVGDAESLRRAVGDRLAGVSLPSSDAGGRWTGSALVLAVLAIAAVVVGVVADLDLAPYLVAVVAGGGVVVLVVAGRAARRREAARRAATFAREARAAVHDAVTAELVDPAARVLGEYADVRAAVDRARAVGRSRGPGRGAPPQSAE